MIVCPNCEHINPDEATQCEACYTPLPQMSLCPSCGATIQTDATFCGQCGYNLQGPATPVSSEESEPEPIAVTSTPATVTPEENEPEPIVVTSTPATVTPEVTPPTLPDPVVSPPKPISIPAPTATRLQMETASLLHVQTDQKVELPLHLSVIHIGKPNDRIPPDIDVSGFPDSDIASRVHADIRVEGGIYYIEDTGSANGTYINHTPLAEGNRHRLRSGDRVSLGKGDKLTFIFQMS